MQPLKINSNTQINDNNSYAYTSYLRESNENNQPERSDRLLLNTYQKKEVKDQVGGLRDELV